MFEMLVLAERCWSYRHVDIVITIDVYEAPPEAKTGQDYESLVIWDINQQAGPQAIPHGNKGCT